MTECPLGQLCGLKILWVIPNLSWVLPVYVNKSRLVLLISIIKILNRTIFTKKRVKLMGHVIKFYKVIIFQMKIHDNIMKHKTLMHCLFLLSVLKEKKLRQTKQRQYSL